jgi:hypothetical protein
MEYYFVRKDEHAARDIAPIDPKDLKPHSLRYEEIIRKNKEELRRKRSLHHVDD